MHNHAAQEHVHIVEWQTSGVRYFTAPPPDPDPATPVPNPTLLLNPSHNMHMQPALLSLP